MPNKNMQHEKCIMHTHQIKSLLAFCAVDNDVEMKMIRRMTIMVRAADYMDVIKLLDYHRFAQRANNSVKHKHC